LLKMPCEGMARCNKYTERIQVFELNVIPWRQIEVMLASDSGEIPYKGKTKQRQVVSSLPFPYYQEE
jgi:hypothetical protein